MVVSMSQVGGDLKLWGPQVVRADCTMSLLVGQVSRLEK